MWEFTIKGDGNDKRLAGLEFPLYVKVTEYDGGTAGRTSGRPEDCYPAEGAEVEFEVENEDGDEIALSAEQGEAITEIAIKRVQEEIKSDMSW